MTMVYQSTVSLQSEFQTDCFLTVFHGIFFKSKMSVDSNVFLLMMPSLGFLPWEFSGRLKWLTSPPPSNSVWTCICVSVCVHVHELKEQLKDIQDKHDFSLSAVSDSLHRVSEYLVTLCKHGKKGGLKVHKTWPQTCDCRVSDQNTGLITTLYTFHCWSRSLPFLLWTLIAYTCTEHVYECMLSSLISFYVYIINILHLFTIFTPCQTCIYLLLMHTGHFFLLLLHIKSIHLLKYGVSYFEIVTGNRILTEVRSNCRCSLTLRLQNEITIIICIFVPQQKSFHFYTKEEGATRWTAIYTSNFVTTQSALMFPAFQKAIQLDCNYYW